jgi:hypothetical protein
MLLALPTFAIADEVGGNDDLQELLGRMSDLEQQLRATNDALAAANARVDQQANQLGKIKSAPTGVMPALSDFLTQTEFSGWVAASYFYNTNNPDNGETAGANGGATPGPGGPGTGGLLVAPFHPDSNSFQVDQVWFAMENQATPESRAGFQVELAWGETADVLRGGSNSGGSAFFDGNSPILYTANVSYLAPITDAGILVTAGRFATHIGAEVAQAPYNYNITRGAVYNLQPINHTGVKIGSSYDNGFDWMLGLANFSTGWGGQQDTDDEKAFLWRVGYKMSDTLAVGINGTYGGDCLLVTGPECGSTGAAPDDSDDKNGIVDIVVNWDPSDKLSTYLNIDYVWADGEGRGGDPSAFGLGMAGRYAITDTWGAALRLEYVGYEDAYVGIGAPNGGFDFDLFTLTATADHALTEHLTVKAELAFQHADGDMNDGRYFRDGSGNELTDNEVLLGVQMLYEF